MKTLKLFKIKTDENRIFGLDFLRAIAIIMVMFLHGNSFLPTLLGEIIGFFLLDGVSIFFVLSGFLIGGIFIKQLNQTSPEKVNLKFLIHFLLRRWLRTIPNYYLALLIIILCFTIKNIPVSNYSLYNYFLFIQNFSSPHPTFFTEAWSLAVEEWFYIIVPSLIIVAYHWCYEERIKKSFLAISFLVSISCILLRFLKFEKMGITNDFELNYKKIVILRLDSIIYGIFMAYLFFFKKELMKKWKNYFAISGLCIIVSLQICKLSPFFITNLSIPLESISTMLLLPYFYFLQIRNEYFKKIITHISIISYSMYLFNYSIVKYEILKSIDWRLIYKFIEAVPKSYTLVSLLQYILFWSVTILISTLVYQYYEKPIFNLRDKIK